MDRVEYLAQISVGRACGFASLAIITTMIGLASELKACLEVGALLTLFMGLFLSWRAWRAPHRDPRITEVWMMLDKGRDLPPDYPPQIIGEVLRQTYIRFAEISGAIALALLAALALVSTIFD